jgi:queuosine precursor transporter
MNFLIFVLQTGAILAALGWAYRKGREALVALCVLFSVLANLFVLKQMLIFGWNVTCSDAFAIGTIFGLNLIQRSYGQAAAKQTIWISFFGMGFFALLSQIHLWFEPSSFDASQDHYTFLLTSAPRLLIASLSTFFLVQQFDVRFFGWLQKRFSGISWKVLSTTSLLVSQALDTVLFSFLGLYGIVQEMASIILLSFAVKCAVIALSSLSNRFFEAKNAV